MRCRIRLLHKAAEQGHAEAQYLLGLHYFEGDGVAEDKTEAIKWFCQATERGNSGAQYHLAECLLCGNGIAKDRNGAIQWFLKAAEQGYVDAQFMLGLCYLNGDVNNDGTTTNEWFPNATEMGIQEMLNDSGQYHYSNRNGSDENKVEAVKWLRKAAEQGHTKAQFMLGVCYFNGDGVERDKAIANEWWQKRQTTSNGNDPST